MYHISLNSGRYIAPSVKIIDDVIENPNEIIALAQQFDDWTDAEIGHHSIETDYRRTKVLMLPPELHNPPQWFNISQIFYAYGSEYANENKTGFSNMEVPQLLHYEAGDGFYKPHIDDSPFIPRNISAILYLNTVNDGGDTYFTAFDLSIKPVAGRLVLFPSNYAYEHEARPPISNDKFVIVQWFGNSRHPNHESADGHSEH